MGIDGRAWMRIDRRGLLAWVALVFVSVALGFVSLAVVHNVKRGAEPSFLGVHGAGHVEPPLSRFPGVGRLDLAGSGSNLPLTRALVDAYTRVHPGVAIRVHESVGSFGGIRAIRDGVIDLALISRPLDPQDLQGSEEDLIEIPYARVAVVFAAHPSVPVSDLSVAQILAFYAGELDTWPDGSRVVVLQREAGDSANRVAQDVLEGFREVHGAAARARRWRVLYRDRAMQEALISTPGAIGLFDLGGAKAQDLPVKVLSLEGVAATERNVRDGHYPLHKPLAFVARGEASPQIQAFLDFVFSAQGQRTILESGYFPVLRHPRAAPAHEGGAVP